MQVKTSDAPARFDPQYITEDDLADLASFTGMGTDECLERVRSYSMTEMAKAWEAVNPTSPSEVMAFYQTTDLYVWELMQWHSSAARTPYWDALVHFAELHPSSDGFRLVFDFGCGIGTDALFLAQRGYAVTAVDVDGPAFAFAQHRLARRGLDCRFVVSTSPIPHPDELFDAAICFDVFEHLSDPLEAARSLVGGLRPRGILIQQAGFGDDGVHPCHLRSGIECFSGLRWHINLVGMGMRNEGSLNYVKCANPDRWIQKARFGLWKMTGLWVTKVGG
jgi:SAM-dependent methyltransferase